MRRSRWILALSLLVTSGPAVGGWTNDFGRPGPSGEVQTTAEFRGDLYVGGRFLRCGNAEAHGIARWDGDRWHAVGDANAFDVTDMVVFRNRLWVAGTFYEGFEARHGMIWDGHEWTPIPSMGDDDGPSRFIVWRGDLYALGGGVKTSTGQREGIARLAGDSWVSVGGGLGRERYSPAVHDATLHEGRLIVGGDFATAGSKGILGLAAWDGTTWRTVGKPALGDARSPGITIRALESLDGRLHATGRFSVDGHGETYSAVMIDNTWRDESRGPEEWLTELGVVDGTLFGVAGDRVSTSCPRPTSPKAWRSTICADAACAISERSISWLGEADSTGAPMTIGAEGFHAASTCSAHGSTARG